MSTDISKTVIRIIHEYCFSNSAPVMVNEFALSVAPPIVKYI